jgi:uncharacterized caspase-like protein
MKFAVTLLAALTLMLAAFGARAAEPPAGPERVALVVGNASYARAPLQNPVRDARLIAATLRELGFQVRYLENAALKDMVEAMRDFLLQTRASQVRVVYFAGHGTQLKGKNYLLPVDAELQDEAEIAWKTANATDFIDRLGQFKSGVNIVILDACRNAPVIIGTRTRGLGATRSLAPGFVAAPAPSGTVIAFSTAPESVAFDGKAANGPYARHLVANMRVPGLSVEQLFKRVRIAVAEETGHQQVPWESTSLVGDFCFRTMALGRCGA